MNPSSQSASPTPVNNPVADARIVELTAEVARLTAELVELHHAGTATALAEQRSNQLRLRILENALRSARSRVHSTHMELARWIPLCPAGVPGLTDVVRRLRSETSDITQALGDHREREGGVSTVTLLMRLVEEYREHFGPLDEEQEIIRETVERLCPPEETMSRYDPRDDTPTQILNLDTSIFRTPGT